MQFWVYAGTMIKESSVAKREETTRTHPEHGRKDS